MILNSKQSTVLVDNHGRVVNYLRLAVTDRCNLRCSYCMPEDGLKWLQRSALLNEEEMMRLCTILVQMGIQKIRITGGEPFIRKDVMSLLSRLSSLQGVSELSITTNGVLTAPYVPELKALGIRSVNLSLDTLDRNRFFSITRRDELPAVLNTLEQLLRYNLEVKINTVVMQGKNTEDIIPLVELTRTLPVGVRFIEEMPFNGDGHSYSGIEWNYLRILQTIQDHYPEIQKVADAPYATAYNYAIPEHKGTVGLIAAYTRTFCGSCNRMRITPEGVLKTCLYDNGVLQLRDLLRQETDDNKIKTAILQAIGARARDGWEAEKFRAPVHESMATIGG